MLLLCEQCSSRYKIWFSQASLFVLFQYSRGEWSRVSEICFISFRDSWFTFLRRPKLSKSSFSLYIFFHFLGIFVSHTDLKLLLHFMLYFDISITFLKTIMVLIFPRNKMSAHHFRKRESALQNVNLVSWWKLTQCFGTKLTAIKAYRSQT